MSDGVDHDFEVPPAAFAGAFAALAARWPEGIAELQGGVHIPLAALAGRAVDALGDGFVVYRDAAARARFHREGGFVDADGESPINVFLGGDAARLAIDLVFGIGAAPRFSLAVHEAIGRGIAGAIGADGAAMDPGWAARTVAVLLPHLSGDARARAEWIALACWHRVRHAQAPRVAYTRPPGVVRVVGGAIEVEADAAGPAPTSRPWGR